MCNRETKSVDHLLIHCQFTKKVWKEIKKKRIKENTKVVFSILKNHFLKLDNRGNVWKELPCFICWEIWKHRNGMIFEEI